VSQSLTATSASMAINQVTICSRAVPFQVRFVSDHGETVGETIQNGFQLGYIQT
jgi:hypothetical protein